ncbi:MAG: DEAD/DEAH box helicase [Planctomycetes bacterium]|nr:DEAD/DEAH box helicase [Planctomycetota bacterium]
MGDGSRKIHPPPRRERLEPQRNEANYRITASDRLGEGSLKQKFRQNIAAIQLLRAMEAQQRPATPDEKAILVKYSGWGGLPQVFDGGNREWRKEQVELSELLTDEEHRSARATTLNAHYTAPTIIAGMYVALERFGFKRGRILEPACGIGHFIGLMPEEMHRHSLITGIEIDSLTARLAKAVYPDADIRQQPFEEAKLADGYYDVAISNVPFGDYQPFDSRFNDYRFPIHDYFFAATLEKVRPGGLVLFITTKGTMDKVNSTLREYLAQRAELLGAIRLPNDAFKKNANTEVTTDIVMLRRLRPGEAPTGSSWTNTAEFTNSLGEAIDINEYFAANPRMMLGEMRLAGRMYRDNEPTLASDGRALEEALSEAVRSLPEAIYRSRKQAVAEPTPEQTIPAPDYVKPNAYALADGEVAIRDGDILRKLPELPSQMRQRIRGLIQVRDSVRECLRTQVDGSAEEAITQARSRLNEAYDSFLWRFGPISDRTNAKAFASDPDLPLLLSLEHYDEETKKAAKAAIFRERTIQYKQPVHSVETAKEALLVSLNEKGRVDFDHIGALLGKPETEFLPELKGAIFLNPQTNEWETDDEYLSGNVRAKLSVADAACITDVRFKENVEALKAVQPEDLPASEIDVRLGACWVPEQDIQKFVHELLQVSSGIGVSHSPALGAWFVTADYHAKSQVSNTAEWGTDRATAIEIIQDTLNLKTPTIYDKDPQTEKLYVNPQATEAARDKQEKIKERFKTWIWSDDERRERLVRQYNDEFNNVRLRTFNGDHLTLPGASQAVTLRAHQMAGVWRTLQTPNTLLGHVVGAGKTYTMVAAAMELKRLGLASKPMFTVPNHMLGQFSSELLTLYPGANILVAGKEDFESSKRRELMSRIATGNWDAVIVTHSGFEKIPLAERTKRDFYNEQLHELELAIRQHADKSNRRLVKDLERAKKRLETRLKLLTADEKKDNTLTFEELGVDRLFVDEAHYFKNLFYISKMTRIAGLPQTASERAFDMFLKVGHVQRVNGGGGVVFATGTPIANSMAEMFTMQRYLQMSALRTQRLHHFDSWAATFGEPVTALELSPDGAGYRLNTRFARFINVPELMQQFRQVADIQTAKMLKLPVPALENERATIISAPATPELKELVASLARRAEALKKGRVDPREDNMLKITSEGRKAALDLRLVAPSARDHPDGKVNLAVSQVYETWLDSAEKRSAQLVFCDLSTPKERGFSVYNDMRDKLVVKGIPTNEIAFIQDYDSDAGKLALFKDVRAGKVRVLFGSTQKMGSGTNVQERLIALHHLDAPWRPADVEQREGRILRQGNTNGTVQIFRYVTEGSFDAYMWQTLETKAKFIHQVMSGDTSVRRIEDIDSAALTYAEVKAIASGNPLVMEKAKVDADVLRLTRLQSQHNDTQYRLRSNLRRTSEEIPIYQKRLAAVQTDIAARQNTQGDAFILEIEGQEIRDRGIAGELLIRRAERVRRTGVDERVGRFAGFDLWIGWGLQRATLLVKGAATHQANVTDSAHGTIRSLEHTVQTFEETASHLGQTIKDSEKRLRDLEPKIGASFEYTGQLASLQKRQQEILGKLDLNKNQAPNQLEAAAGEDNTEKLEVGETVAPAETKPVQKPTRRRHHGVKV